MKNKLFKGLPIIVISLIIVAGIYFLGSGFETKYFVTSLETGQYGWIKKQGGYSYQSKYTYDTYEEAQEAARSHRQDFVNDKIIKETLLTLVSTHNTEPVDIQFKEMQEGVQKALITIDDNGTIWIDPSLSREDIVKEMLRGLWPNNYELIYGDEK